MNLNVLIEKLTRIKNNAVADGISADEISVFLFDTNIYDSGYDKISSIEYAKGEKEVWIE